MLVQYVFIAVGVLWPLIAFAGGLGFSVLLPIAAILCLRAGAPGFKFRAYMVALLLTLEFIAASARWSPRPINLVDIDWAKGSFAIRFEVARVGLALMWASVLMSAARTLSPVQARRVVRVVSYGLLLQLVVVGVLAAFERQALNTLSGLMSNQGEGVQNISRNGIIMALAAPLLIVGLGRTMSVRRATVVELVVFAAVVGVLITRGVDGGVVSVAAAVASVGVIRLMPKHGYRVLGGLIAAAIMTVPTIIGYLARDANVLTATTSAGWRLAIWRRVGELIGQDPIFGQGLGVLRTLRDTIPAGAFKDQQFIPNHAHNMVMQLWVETGAIGATLLSVTVLLVAFRMPQPRALGVAGYLGAALAGGFMAIALVSFDLWNDWWWACAGLIAALSVVMLRAETVEAPSRILTAPDQSQD